MNDKNMFLTLTYNDKNLPDDGSLVKKDFQDFMKRLRKKICRYFHYNRDWIRHSVCVNPIRYYHCGEYGEKLGRPHYHALIFGYEFPDLKFWREINGQILWTSKLLEKTWDKGFCSVGAVTFASAAYVARYIMKKQNGPTSIDHYVDKQTGMLRLPEYTTMSRKPGLGFTWYQKYGDSDCHNEDFIPLLGGKKTKVPRYYDVLLSENDPEAHADIKEQRIATARYWADNNTPERLKVREYIQERKLQQLPRELS